MTDREKHLETVRSSMTRGDHNTVPDHTPTVSKEAVTLAQCPIGLFWHGDELCLKTEYGNNEGRIDAYIVSSGEFYWGDAPQTIASQRAQMVVPVDQARFEAHLRTPAKEAREMVADSGMSGEAVERAEWAWANLPVGPRKWTSLATHEKALVCHTITRLSNDTEAMRQIAADLIDQRDEPDMFGVSYDRVHYWRDKAINAAARIDRELAGKGGV